MSEEKDEEIERAIDWEIDPALATEYRVSSFATSTAGAIDYFKNKGVEITAEEIQKEGHPIEDALNEVIPIFNNIPELQEIKVGFEVAVVNKKKGKVGIDIATVFKAGGWLGREKSRTHRMEFLLKKNDKPKMTSEMEHISASEVTTDEFKQ